MVGTEQNRGPRIIAVGSGKGGTGKTLLAANIGVFLATLGKRVILVDAAFGSANLHAFAGVARPPRTLGETLGNSAVALDHAVVSTSIAELGLIAGEGDPAWAANPKSAQINRLIARMRQLDADYVIIDLNGGSAGNTLDLFLIADIGIVILLPEPTSVELAYRFLRAGFVRRLRRIGLGEVTDVPAEELRLFEGGIPSPSDLHERAKEMDSGLAERVGDEMASFAPGLVINYIRSKAEMDFGSALVRAVRRRFGVAADYLGHLEYDDAVWVAVRRRRPLLIEHPESRVAHCIERVVRRILALDTERGPMLPTSDSYYDLLEIEPSATEEEIRRANRRIREIYARDSVIVGGLYNKSRLDDVTLRIDEAYETLMDAHARKAYDQALFPGGVPTQQPAAANGERDTGPVELPEEKSDQVAREEEKKEALVPPPPDVPPDTDFTGPLMKEIRESQGIDLREISERTKVGIGYLSAIEEENFKKLPAVVYVRGFLTEYARMLRISPDGVLGTYLERYREVRAQLDAEE